MKRNYPCYFYVLFIKSSSKKIFKEIALNHCIGVEKEAMTPFSSQLPVYTKVAPISKPHRIVLFLCVMNGDVGGWPLFNTLLHM